MDSLERMLTLAGVDSKKRLAAEQIEEIRDAINTQLDEALLFVDSQDGVLEEGLLGNLFGTAKSIASDGAKAVSNASKSVTNKVVAGAKAATDYVKSKYDDAKSKAIATEILELEIANMKSLEALFKKHNCRIVSLRDPKGKVLTSASIPTSTKLANDIKAKMKQTASVVIN